MIYPGEDAAGERTVFRQEGSATDRFTAMQGLNL